MLTRRLALLLLFAVPFVYSAPPNAHEDKPDQRTSSKSKDASASWVAENAKEYLHKTNSTPKEFYQKWFPDWHSLATEPDSNSPFYSGSFSEGYGSDTINQIRLNFSMIDAAGFVDKTIGEMIKQKGEVDLPLEKWQQCARALQLKSQQNVTGVGAPWKPEKVQRYWAILEYLNGIINFYSKNSAPENDMRRARETLLKQPGLSEEQKKLIQETRLDPSVKTLKEFSSDWRKTLDTKYPDQRLFHLDHPEKECIDLANEHEYIHPEEVRLAYRNARRFQHTPEGKVYTEPWEKVPRH